MMGVDARIFTANEMAYIRERLDTAIDYAAKDDARNARVTLNCLYETLYGTYYFDPYKEKQLYD